MRVSDVFSEANLICFLAQFIAAGIYAYILEKKIGRKNYEPGKTWMTVVWGNFQVGLIVALRLALAAGPELGGELRDWWNVALWTLSFVFAGIPIIWWQVMVQTGRQQELEQELRSFLARGR